MAILSVREFNTSRFGQIADSTEASVPAIIARAEAAITRRLRRPIEPETFEEEYLPDNNTIYLRNRPIIRIEEIRVSSLYGQTFTSPMYSIDKNTGILRFPRTLAGRRVVVRYVAGFDPIPEDLKEAVILQAVLFMHQDLEIYGGAGDGKEPGILYYQRDITNLLKPYQQLHMAYT